LNSHFLTTFVTIFSLILKGKLADIDKIVSQTKVLSWHEIVL